LPKKKKRRLHHVVVYSRYWTLLDNRLFTLCTSRRTYMSWCAVHPST